MAHITSTTKHDETKHSAHAAFGLLSPLQRSLPAAIYMTLLILRVTNFMKQTLFETLQSLSRSKKKFPHLMGTDGSWQPSRHLYVSYKNRTRCTPRLEDHFLMSTFHLSPRFQMPPLPLQLCMHFNSAHIINTGSITLLIHLE